MASQPNKKRELIFIILAVAALIYGAVDFGIRSIKGKSAPPGSSKVETSATFSLITEELGAPAASQQKAKGLEILNAVSVAWPEGLFADITAFADHEEEEEALTLVDKALIYSGYMTMGEKIFAVINGIEYRIGDIVEGFFLKKIDPMEIIMEKNGRPMRIPFKRID
jgi:hypothetical protein